MHSKEEEIDKDFIVACLTKQPNFTIRKDCGGLFLLKVGLVLGSELCNVFRVGAVSFYVANRGDRPMGYVLDPGCGNVVEGGYYTLVTDRGSKFEGMNDLYEDDNVIVSQFDMSIMMSAKKQLVKTNAEED